MFGILVLSKWVYNVSGIQMVGIQTPTVVGNFQKFKNVPSLHGVIPDRVDGDVGADLRDRRIVVRVRRIGRGDTGIFTKFSP